MAGQSKEVSLVIKAKDQAKKAIDSVADALAHLNDVQTNTGQGAVRAGGLLGKLQTAFSGLDREIKGLAALNKVAANMDRAAVAVGQLDAKVRDSVVEQKRLSAAQQEAAANTAKLKQQVDAAKAAYDKQRQAVSGLTADQKKDKAATDAARQARDQLKESLSQVQSALNTAKRREDELADQVTRVNRSTEAQTTALAEANAELNEIAAMAQKASAALGGVEATQTAVAAASAKATAEQERLRSAMAAAASTARQPDRLLQGGVVTAGAAPATDTSGTLAALRAYREAQAELRKVVAAQEVAGGSTEALDRDFAVASANVQRASAAYREQRESLRLLTEAQKTEVATDRQVGETAGVAAGKIRQQTVAHREAATAGNRLGGAFEGIYGKSRQAMSIMQRLRGEILSLASAYVGLYAAINAIGGIIQTSIAYQSAQNKLGVVFGQNAAQVGAEMAYLESEADRLGEKFTTLADNYADFAVASQGANFSLEDTRRIFKAVTESGVVLNVSADDMQGIFKALTQIMSKGSVQAEELRGQLGDRMTGAFRLMADAIGVSTGELDKMLKTGQVVADRNTLVSFADTLTKKYGNELPAALQSLNAELGRFSNNKTEAEKRIGEAGFTDALVKALRELNQYFESDSGKKFFDGIGAALGKMVSLLPGIVKNIGMLVATFQVFAGVKLANIIIGLIPAFTSFGTAARTAFIAAQADVRVFTAAMQVSAAVSVGAARTGFLAAAGGLTIFRGAAVAAATGVRTLTAAFASNPLGLLVTGLSLLATFILPGMLTSTDRLTEALNKQEDIMGKVDAAYAKAGGSVDEFKKSLDGVTESTIVIEMAKIAKGLDDLKNSARKPFSYGSVFDATPFAKMSPEIADVTNKLWLLTDAFQHNKISATDYQKQVEDLIAAHPALVSANQKLVDGLRDNAAKAVEAQQKTEWYSAALAFFQGKATDAQNATLGFANAVDAANASLDTKAVYDYADALAKLQDYVPALKAANDLADQNTKIDQTVAEVAARAIMGDPQALAYLPQIQAAAGQAKSSVQDQYNRSNNPHTGGGSGGRSGGKSDADRQKEFNDQLQQTIAQRTFEIAQLQRTEKEQQVQEALERARADALRNNVKFSDDQAAAIRKSVEADYDANAAAAARKQIDDARLELAKAQGKEESRAGFIAREAGAAKIDLLTEEGQQWAQIKGLIYDVAKAEDDRRKAHDAVDGRVSDLSSGLDSIETELSIASEAGDTAKVNELRYAWQSVRQELLKAIDAQIAYYKTLDPSTNPGIRVAIATAEATRASLNAATQQFRIFGIVIAATGPEIRDNLLDNIGNGIDSFAQKIADGRAVLKSFGESVRQTVADSLLYIAKLVQRALLLKALNATPLGKWLGGALGSEGDAIANGADRLKEAAVAVTAAAAAIAASAMSLKAAGLTTATAGSPSSGGGWLSSAVHWVASLFGHGGTTAAVHHAGGVAGASGMPTRNVWSGYFQNAMRYHGGGIVGLKPGEVPIIAKQGETVMTPEQMANMAAGGQPSIVKNDTKIINTFTGEDMARHMTQDTAGQRVIINWMRDNKRSIQGVLG